MHLRPRPLRLRPLPAVLPRRLRVVLHAVRAARDRGLRLLLRRRPALGPPGEHRPRAAAGSPARGRRVRRRRGRAHGRRARRVPCWSPAPAPAWRPPPSSHSSTARSRRPPAPRADRRQRRHRVGVLLAGPLALALAGHWRVAWLCFAALTVAATVVTMRAAGCEIRRHAGASGRALSTRRRSLRPAVLAALLAGTGSRRRCGPSAAASSSAPAGCPARPRPCSGSVLRSGRGHRGRRRRRRAQRWDVPRAWAAFAAAPGAATAGLAAGAPAYRPSRSPAVPPSAARTSRCRAWSSPGGPGSVPTRRARPTPSCSSPSPPVRPSARCWSAASPTSTGLTVAFLVAAALSPPAASGGRRGRQRNQAAPDTTSSYDVSGWSGHGVSGARRSVGAAAGACTARTVPQHDLDVEHERPVVDVVAGPAASTPAGQVRAAARPATARSSRG